MKTIRFMKPKISLVSMKITCLMKCLNAGDCKNWSGLWLLLDVNMRLYEGCKEILRIQKFRRIVGYTVFYCFSAVISYAYTSNTWVSFFFFYFSDFLYKFVCIFNFNFENFLNFVIFGMLVEVSEFPKWIVEFESFWWNVTTLKAFLSWFCTDRIMKPIYTAD